MAGEFDPLAALSPIERLRLGLELQGANLTPEEMAAARQRNATDALSMVPGPGNVMAAEDAARSGADAYNAFAGGDVRGGVLNAALAALSGAGAVMGFPGSSAARRAAEGASSRLNVLIPAEPAQSTLTARGMRERDATNPDVFDRTGLVYGHEGRLKQDIPDVRMEVSVPHGVQVGDTMPLGDIVQHPELFSLIPHLAEQPVRWTDKVDERGLPVARTDPVSGVFELNRNAPDLRGGVAKLMQYRIGRESGFSAPVRHGYDKIRADIDNAAGAARASNPEGEALDAYLAMLEANRTKMADVARSHGGNRGMHMADRMMGQRSAGNFDAKLAERRATRPETEGTYPYTRNAPYMPRKSSRKPAAFEEALVLPQPGATPEEVRQFLANWHLYGSGRGP
jgi:hypothetical protein